MPLTDDGIYFEYWETSPNPHDSHAHPLTLINGYARSMSDFRSLARSLQRAGIAVIMLDNRTTGKTTAPAPFTLPMLANDVVSVWDSLGISKAHVLGISMGGAIAMTVAVRHPQRVAKLVLVSSFSQRSYEAHTDTEEELEQVRTRIINSVAPCFYQKNKPLMHALAKQAAAQICAGTHRPQTQALHNYNASQQLADVRCPTLIIHGDKDNIVPQQEAESLATSINAAKLVIIKEAGHMLLMEKHSALLAEVVNFIKS
ncbi:MAG: alpha/beta hydrolase [Pseudomonadota bacterium]|nr:alpha/beta hydrolase [Pseudomonadota bacterium]